MALRLPIAGWTAAVATLCALWLAATGRDLPLVWDEGNAILRAQGIARWCGRWAEQTDTFAAPLRSDAIAADWAYATVEEGHPAAGGILIAAGSALGRTLGLKPLAAARLAPILFFALATAAMFHRLAREYGLVVATIAAIALATLPRMLAHAHFAALDGPLTSAWLLAWAGFAPARRRAGWAMFWGACLGLTFSIKFTGLLAVVPFALWAIIYRERGTARALLIGLPIAAATFWLLNPPLWHAPIEGLRTFFQLNLFRHDRPEHNISTQFFGSIYNLDFPPPWYNALAWVALTVPLATMLPVGVGLVAAVRNWRQDRTAVLLALNWGILTAARSMPFAPAHDAERLFLPGFAFLAALAGVGGGRMLYRRTLLEERKIPAQGWAKVALAIALVGTMSDLYFYAPHWLSYYSRGVGGLPGAAALGLEPTYWWDALDEPAWRWLHEHSAADEKIAFGSAPAENLALLTNWGVLRRGYRPGDPGEFRWYVIQHRPSAHRAWDRRLLADVAPAYQRTLLGVPLLSVFSHDQYERARKEAAAAPRPAVRAAAYEAHPERFVRQPPRPLALPSEVWVRRQDEHRARSIVAAKVIARGNE